MKKITKNISTKKLNKVKTGINGLDDITSGGFPKGRPTLICGNAGSGKTLLALQFLVNGANLYNEPGVFFALEESEIELAQNVSSLGVDLKKLEADKKIIVEHINFDPVSLQQSGEFDLEGLFVRLDYTLKSIGAKRVVIDTIETIFSLLPNQELIRSELIRLFRWFKEKKLTVVITGEQGEGLFTRSGLGEYVSDCVIFLDHRIERQSSTRRLRVVKYRGSTHGTNEYPFLINAQGFSVLPITSLSLQHPASNKRISSGVPRLDNMLGGKGFFRGSSILVSGTAGVGKTSLASHFADAGCKRNEKVLYFSFEESAPQLIRNMSSIGIDLQQWIDKKLLLIHSARPTLYGIENHLTRMYKLIEEFNPSLVIVDPITSFNSQGDENTVKELFIRVMDLLKTNNITAFLTSLTSSSQNIETSETEVSSLIDSWILLKDIESIGERNKGLYIIKSRGMSHSNQIREFMLTDNGAELTDVYLGADGVLTGSARLAKESKEKNAESALQQDIQRKNLEIEKKKKILDLQISLLKLNFEAEEKELLSGIDNHRDTQRSLVDFKKQVAKKRKAD